MSLSKGIKKTNLKPWQLKLHEVIFEAETKAGKLFDTILLIVISLSLIVVMLESVEEINKNYGLLLYVLEWIFTGLFLIEYILRILCIGRPIRYILSFYGIIDILSIIPAFLGIFIKGTNSLIVIRTIRLMRIFRIFKLGKHLEESSILYIALLRSRHKIFIFLLTMLFLVIILGTMMYIIEPHENGFTSIPRSIYWAIVTITTVGYGDIYPQTAFGQFLASAVMIIGYAIIAIPTGIITSEISSAKKSNESDKNTISCENCGSEGHKSSAKYCYKCGHSMD